MWATQSIPSRPDLAAVLGQERGRRYASQAGGGTSCLAPHLRQRTDRNNDEVKLIAQVGVPARGSARRSRWRYPAAAAAPAARRLAGSQRTASAASLTRQRGPKAPPR